MKKKFGRRSCFITIGHYPDGRPGELFVDASKAGSEFCSLMNAFAIAVSLALQYGMPASEIAEALGDFHEGELPRVIADTLGGKDDRGEESIPAPLVPIIPTRTGANAERIPVPA